MQPLFLDAARESSSLKYGLATREYTSRAKCLLVSPLKGNVLQSAGALDLQNHCLSRFEFAKDRFQLLDGFERHLVNAVNNVTCPEARSIRTTPRGLGGHHNPRDVGIGERSPQFVVEIDHENA